MSVKSNICLHHILFPPSLYFDSFLPVLGFTSSVILSVSTRTHRSRRSLFGMESLALTTVRITSFQVLHPPLSYTQARIRTIFILKEFLTGMKSRPSQMRLSASCPLQSKTCPFTTMKIRSRHVSSTLQIKPTLYLTHHPMERG